MLKRLAARESVSIDAISPRSDPFYRAYLASKALVAAINRADDVDVVRWICCEYCPSVVPVNAMVKASKVGRLRVLQWLFERFPNVQPTGDLAENAIVGDHFDTLKWVASRFEVPFVRSRFEAPFVGCGGSLLCFAAKCGSVEIVRWLHGEVITGSGVTSPPRGLAQIAFAKAVTHGRFDAARFLSDQGHRLDDWRAGHLHFSASRRNLEMLKWLHAEGYKHGATGWIDMVAPTGQLDAIQWIHENIYEGKPHDMCTTAAMNEAAKNGHLDVVQWLHTNRSEGCTFRAMDHAAEHNHLEIIQWLHTNRAEGCSADAMNLAAMNGHLGVVQWLHEHRGEGCTVRAMNEAAENGHLEVVQWLHEHRNEGCTHLAMDCAAGNGHLDVVEWLHEHRDEGCTTLAMDMAASQDHLHVIQWLHENRSEGCTVDAMNQANAVQTLQWFHENRSEGCSPFATEIAGRHGNFAKLLFLKEKSISVFTERAVASAFRGGSFEIFQWLRANHPEHVDTAEVERISRGRGAQTMFLQFETDQTT